MNLIIIEGVGKKDTIKKYLGENFEVVATKGHIRDLPEKSLGVNVLENFKPQYDIISNKKDIVKMLKEKSKKAENIYLATDPDREGEAISWHLCNILELDETHPVRIEFNEISKNAVANALKNPRPIDRKLVDAQQARRVLDRLVGYKLSPILCKKIQSNLSAGRVQSVALKLIVEREKEIQNFVVEEYWTLNANLFKESPKDVFKSTLSKINGKKPIISNKEEMDNILDSLKDGQHIVKNIKKSISKTRPSPPYTTSTMQQDALNRLGMSLKKASMCAQELYEGVNLNNEGKVALITYIRTDSVRVAPFAMEMAKNYIKDKYRAKYLPKTPNFYKVKKSAQDAHEAIRPISLDRTPESLKGYLSNDNYKLYKMIYNKFLASQMADATFNSVTVEIENGKNLFIANGKTPIFDGFTVLNSSKSKKNDSNEEEKEDNSKMPELTEGYILKLDSLVPNQKFTKPPQRYTEATLVKEMEDKGIGRPATYTPTILLLASRKYTDKEGKSIFPTELGFKVDELLEKYFSGIINIKFTADMEDKLDEIAQSGAEWQEIIKKFYNYLIKAMEVADKDSAKFKTPPKETDIECNKCGHKMVIRNGRFGEFLACGNFPACKNIQSLSKPVAVCPKCKGDVLERRSKKGNIFFGCSNYPNCDFVSWEKPIKENCPQCNTYLTQKEIYGNIRKKCSNPECKYTETIKKSAKTKEDGTND